LLLSDFQCTKALSASGGETVLANDRNGGRLRLIASRHDDDDDEGSVVSQPIVMKLLIHINDNILHRVTVADFLT